MKRLVVILVVVAATMALAPSVASARTSPELVSPIRTSPMPAKPARWSYMWLRDVRIYPVSPVAPLPKLERTSAVRVSALRLALLKLHAHAR